MICPENRLLLWTGFLVLPCATLAALFPAQVAWLGLPAGGFALLLGIDAIRGARVARNLVLTFPEVTRLVRGRPGNLEIKAARGPAGFSSFRLGLVLPPGVTSESVERWIELPGGSPQALISWPCSAWRRGKFLLESCRVAFRSPWAFWEVRRVLPARAQIRVYPDLLSDRRAAAAIFLHRGNPGRHQFRQVGQGREYEKLRDYQPGDSYDEIHWKATAKRNRPVTKVFQIERTREVYVMIDASRLSGRMVAAPVPAGGLPDSRAIREEFALERFVNAALLLALAAEGQGDLFGLLAFDDKLGTFLPAGHGLGHFRACREAVYGLMPKSVSPDFGEVFTFIRTRLRKRSLLVFLTSLEDPVVGESFLRHVQLVSREHLVLVLSLRPEGAIPLFDKRSDPSVVDDLYSLLGGHFRWAELKKIGRELEQRGVRFAMAESEALGGEIISRYIEVKRRQTL